MNKIKLFKLFPYFRQKHKQERYELYWHQAYEESQ